MSLALTVLVALALGLLLGGRLGRLAELPLRAPWLFLSAVALQVVAFPVGVLPWRTHETVASVLWITSYGLLLAAAVLNRRIVGVPIVASGMLLNLSAILVNRGTMPVRVEAMHDAGRVAVTHANSTALANPALPWLVDRWAAPNWIPLANVFSIGDVAIAIGAMVIVLAGMGVRPQRLLIRRDPSV